MLYRMLKLLVFTVKKERGKVVETWVDPNIYGGTKEFRKISTFSKFKILKLFTPYIGALGLLPSYFRNSSVLPQALPMFRLHFLLPSSR